MYFFSVSFLRLRQLSLTLCSLPATFGVFGGGVAAAAAATLLQQHPCNNFTTTTHCALHSTLPARPSSSPARTLCALPRTVCPVARGNPNAVPCCALIAWLRFIFFPLFFFVSLSLVAFLCYVVLFSAVFFFFCICLAGIARRLRWSWISCSIFVE